MIFFYGPLYTLTAFSGILLASFFSIIWCISFFIVVHSYLKLIMKIEHMVESPFKETWSLIIISWILFFIPLIFMKINN